MCGRRDSHTRLFRGARSLRARARPALVGAKSEPLRGSLQQLRVLCLVDELVTSTAHGNVRLRATERVVESACRLLGRLIVERFSYDKRRRLNAARKVGGPSCCGERGSAEHLTPPDRFRACPWQSSNPTMRRESRGRLVGHNSWSRFAIPVDEEITLGRHVHRIARHTCYRRKPRRREHDDLLDVVPHEALHNRWLSFHPETNPRGLP